MPSNFVNEGICKVSIGPVLKRDFPAVFSSQALKLLVYSLLGVRVFQEIQNYPF